MISMIDGHQTASKAVITESKTVTKDKKATKPAKKDNKKKSSNDNPYAIGMAAAKKIKHDKPPLKKSTIKKGHEIADAIKKKETKSKSKPTSKKSVKESTFKELVRIVAESKGKTLIEAVDKELFNWAYKIATVKEQDESKQEVYAGLLYERFGGKFKIDTVINESK